MITYSIINKSQLEGAHRIDAEYYQPEYLDISDKLQYSPMLNEVSEKITDFGAYSQMNFVKYVDSGIRFLRNHDVGEVFINDSDAVFIPPETYNKLSLKLDRFDIITPRVGALGNAAIVLDGYLPASANQNLAQIKPNIKKINPFYLAVFLCSFYGKKQFERFATGNVQPWLNLFQIKSLKVFVPSSKKQEEIKKICLESLYELKNSQNYYAQAENLLLEELGLKDYKIEDNLSFVVNLSDVKSAGRMDPDYFQPKYDLIISKIGKNKKRLLELVRKEKQILKINPEREYNYIEISDVNVANGEVGFNKILGKELPANAKILIKGNELIVSKVRPTRGAVAIIPENWKNDYIASGAFSVFNVNSPTREYLQIVLRSIIGKLQLEKPTTGTSYPTVTDQDIENIWIPDLSKTIQQRIADLVTKSHEARKKSKELLEEAKRKVEEMIEKGDK